MTSFVTSENSEICSIIYCKIILSHIINCQTFNFFKMFLIDKENKEGNLFCKKIIRT